MKIYPILVLAIPMVLSSCLEDRTTEATNPISEIIIVDGSVKSQYDINKNDSLTITPEIVQNNKEKPLSFSWEINGKEYSNDAVFNFIGDALGSYQCRLVVANEDGKAFQPFTLNVNSPYEEGITIISKTPEGESRLSFMLTRPDGTDSTFYDYDCFTMNNRDETFASNVSDMRQCGSNLLIACQGTGVPGDYATIYYLNEKTFVIENILSVPEYPDFKPTKMQMPSLGWAGTTYPILCENGKIYEFSETEGTLVPGTKLSATYAQSCASYEYENGNYYNLVFWDEELGALCQIYTGYGPYYCSTTTQLERSKVNETTNYFNGWDFVAMFVPRQTDAQQVTEAGEIVVIVKKGIEYRKVRLNNNFWVYNEDIQKSVLSDNGGLQPTGFGSIKFSGESPYVANRTYYSLLFSDGTDNKVYKWNYTSGMLSNAKSIATVGSSNAVITSMEISNDHKRTYVAYYEPDEAGLNGHVTVLDTNTGEIIGQYDNVCYRPVKIMYKKK